jgi:hypothetical protein
VSVCEKESVCQSERSMSEGRKKRIRRTCQSFNVSVVLWNIEIDAIGSNCFCNFIF